MQSKSPYLGNARSNSVASFVWVDGSRIRLSQYLDALTCYACTCYRYAYACNAHMCRDYRRQCLRGYCGLSGIFILGVHRIRI